MALNVSAYVIADDLSAFAVPGGNTYEVRVLLSAYMVLVRQAQMYILTNNFLNFHSFFWCVYFQR